MMRRILVNSADDIRVERVPFPEAPGEGQVLVHSRLVGICGSDTHAAAGRHPFIRLPYRPGHEVVGVVGAIGQGVTGLSPGDRVVVEPNLVCGRCRQCREGRYNICRELAVFGCQTPGGMADAFTIAADRLHPVPDGMSDELAALVEPLATPVRAVRRAGIGPGSRVVVLGAGPIGLLTMVAARAAGAATVLVTDVLAGKRERAVRLGADAALDAADPGLVDAARDAMRGGGGGEGGMGGEGADAVFDCVAVRSSMAQAAELLDKGGTVVVVGVPHGPTDVPLHLVQDREIAVLGSLMYVREDVLRAIRLLADGVLRANELVTAVFPLEQASEAYAASIRPDQVKVLIRIAE
ncbi:alcohol dehydrogenase catalytic domain-containing protein [Pseudonocardia eucalypti]|uniref:Alcohol dehydrogenase catalytic domain-containing protein n=2 Tax=Pseudonocardia eucalypti TaxID=648755 RepID=A0ABP9Q6D0_9PSEU